MILSVTAGYLWLPVKRTNPVVKLHFHAEGRKFQEIDIPLGYDYAEYYAPMDLLLFIGPKPGSNPLGDKVRRESVSIGQT